MLALGVLAQAAGTLLVSTPAFLIPLLHTQQGLSLASAGLIASMPTLGMVATLILWGALSDRVGERVVISTGLLLASAGAAAAAATAGNLPLLGLFLAIGGAATASANAASGRLVVGWFPRNRRGLAMGIRQMSQPLGVAVAALVVPGLAVSWGIAGVLLVSTVVCAVLGVVCALTLRDPARAGTAGADADTENPYRGSSLLWRIHGVSLLLVVPQFTLSTFGLVWLVTEEHLSAALAGTIIAVAQFIGAFGRIGAGMLSDTVGSRLRPLRWVALAAVAAMLVLAAVDGVGGVVVIVAFVLATTISVADNGLAFTAVAEIAGPRWSGRALGAQNTGQFIAASAVGPAAGALIGGIGFPVTFVVVAVVALVAVPLVPRR
jgi:MFS family permease